MPTSIKAAGAATGRRDSPDFSLLSVLFAGVKNEGGGAFKAAAGKRKSGQLSFMFLCLVLKTIFPHIIGVHYLWFFHV